MNTAKLTVPVYDLNGKVTSCTIPSENLSPKVFTAIELVQHWYYDHTNNVVFNKIREAYLYAKKGLLIWRTKKPPPF